MKSKAASRGPCTPAIRSAWISVRVCTRWTRPPSTSACRCSPGPSSASTKLPSRCTRCWTCWRHPQLYPITDGKTHDVNMLAYLRRVGVHDFPFEACSGWTARYGLPACSPSFLWTLSRGFRPADYPAAPLVSFHAYRQLHGWAPSSHRVSAPKRRTVKGGLTPG